MSFSFSLPSMQDFITIDFVGALNSTVDHYYGL